jgi:hypothetical protein
VKGTYFRWTRERKINGRAGDATLHADILGADIDITADPTTGLVRASIPGAPLDADSARMIGVRLIEAAVLADNGRSVREA